MTKLRKGLAVLVAFVLVFSAMIQATFAAPENAGFSDVTGHWAEDQILEWSDKGIIVGNNGKFSPDSGITRAEFCSIINRAFGFSEKSGSNFFDIKPEKWYSKDVAIAKEAGYILGYGNNLFGPEDKITRQDAARILQNIFKFEASEGQSKTPFVDDKDIASYAKEAVAVFSSKGYILGDKNHFYPKNSITRAEFVAIMDRAVDQLYVAAGTYKESKVAGNAVVKTGDVILKDMVIEGNLYLAEGIGQGNVTLENVTVKGKTFVNGGGENSIILQNTTLGSLVIEKKDGKIRIVAKDGTVVAYAELHSGARLEEEGTGSGFENVEVQEILPGQQIILDGDFKLVNIEAPGVAMQVTDGTVGTFTIGSHASGSSIQVAQGTVVGTLAANAPVSVSGQGKITHAQINAAGVVLEQRPGRVTLSAGVTASVSGQTVNQSYNKSTGGGSSSSENNTPEKVATPVFSVPAGTYTTVQSIAITCSTAGSSIRYTIDGSTPNADSTLYTSPISIVSNTTLKAIAIKSGKTDSSVASATYIINIIPETVATPVFNVPEGTYTIAQNVEITCGTAGASIRYTTDGSTPNADSTLYTSPINIETTTTLKAIAIKSGMTDSSVASATYTINITPETVATPVFSVPEGTYTIAQNVEITCGTAGASIRYTIDGSTPNADSTLYTSPINIETTTTLKAIAIKSGMTDSSVASATYIINIIPETVATPVFSVPEGTYTIAQNVEITCSTAGSSIRYTTDGSTPNADSTLYTSPINIETTTTLKAIAIKSGMTDSSVASATYTINPSQEDPWTLVWSDEFDGSSIDTDKWRFENSGGGFGNNEQQYYRTQNAVLEDGKLVIKAKKEDYDIRHYTSAKLYSKAAWKYGRFEACIKLPLGQGFWPAFWMMPNDGAYGDNGVTGAYGGWAASGEIDIMEAKGRIPNVASGALHYGGAWPNNKFTGEEYTFPSGQVIDQFHTYSLEWEPGEIRWYIDGQLYQTQNNWNTKGADGEEKFAFPAPFDKEFYLMLNLAIGGNFDGGLMPDDSMFPAQMEVDYVRVYTLTGRPYMAPVEPSIVIEPLPEDAREPDDTGNLVKDFNFSEGIKDNPEGDDADFGEVWNFVHNAQFGGTATTAVENIDGKNYAKIDVTNRGSQPYSVQLEQLTTLGKGRWYRFSFDAKADKNRALSTKLGGGSDAGWAAYSDAYSPNLTTEIQHFSYEFQMTRDTDIKTRIEFNCATDTGPVWMGNVRVEEINPPSVDYHAAKEPLPSGNHIYNGAFDKYTIDRMAYWNVSMSGASAVVKVPETTRELTAEITEGGTDAGDITVDQKGLQLIKNSEYKLTFKARADAGRTIRVKLASKDGSTVYIPEQEITLTTDMQVFEETFKMAADTDREAQLIFLLGGSNSVVYIDDVSLICTTVDYTGVELYPLNNGDFSLGLTGWTTFTQPGSTAAANFSVENSEAKISVSNVGSGEWHVMLFHPNIAISKGITYEFSFDAKASVDRDIQVTIENDNYQPGFPKTSIQLTSEKKNFSYTFTPTKDESLTLKFLMGSTAKGVPGDIFISNVVLQVKNAPVSRPPSFAPDTSNNRLGQQIELIFGDDTAWRAVNPTVKVEDQVLTADQYAFTSGMITLNSSVFDTAKRYKIVIQATGYADVVVMQDILANDGNAVKNGDMSNGTENWNTWNGDGGIGALEVVDGVAKIDISNIGPQNWSIQLYQDGVLIEAGKTYELSLKAWSTIDRPIQVEFTGYNGNESVKFNLTSDNSAIHKYYLSIPQTNSSFKLNFLIGNVVNGVKTTPSDAHILYIDDVVIKEAVVQNAPSLIADLTENVIGQDIEITFTDDSAWRAAIEAVKVDGVVLASSAYSIIAGKLTIDRSCFVEGRDYTIIVEAEGYYHTQVTQTMQSGKIWVEVGSNLITDGTFDTTTTSFDAIWSIHNQGLYESWAGLGAFEVVDGAVEVTVNQVGWDWWQIQLFQLNVNVPAGVYKIAFDMSSEIERPVYVELTGSSAPRQTFTVGSITQTYEAIINVTAPGSFKFMFGLGRAGTDPELTTPYKITIDNVKLIEVKEAAPALIADDTNNTLGKDINITFADNEEWRNAIIDVKVNDIPLDENAYIITNNSIIINADQFPIVGDYTITVDAASYTHAQVVQTIIAPWIEIGTNLLTDGTFDATTTFDTIWKIHNQGIYESWAGLAAFEVVSGIVETTVNQVGWDWWQIQLYQENVNVPAGTYKIAFDMSSEIERPVYVELTGSSAPRQTFAVGSITQTYEAIINVTAPGSFKFMFGLGRAGTDPELTTPYKITIDNVKLIEVQH